MSQALEIAQAFYASLAKGDVSGALALLDPAVEWTEAERSPYFAGTLRGPDTVVEKVLAPVITS